MGQEDPFQEPDPPNITQTKLCKLCFYYINIIYQTCLCIYFKGKYAYYVKHMIKLTQIQHTFFHLKLGEC